MSTLATMVAETATTSRFVGSGRWIKRGLDAARYERLALRIIAGVR